VLTLALLPVLSAASSTVPVPPTCAPDCRPAITAAIAACADLFAKPRVTTLAFTMTSAAGKASKKATKAKAEAAK
jgi:hypothetical protein